MRTVCAWCQKVLQDGPPPTSHGMCRACEVKLAIDVQVFEEVKN